MGLWMTIQSCELEFLGTDMTREYIIVSNGNAETIDTIDHIKHLKTTGLLRHYSHTDEAIAAPTARQMGVEHATGKYLAFFDNHCIAMKDYFLYAKHDFETLNCDMLHGVTRYDVYRQPVYHYCLKLKMNFWGGESPVPDHNLKPYKIAMAGHGAFLVRADVFKEVGGYWTGFRGYAGEEPYFDLKMALLDKTNFLDPRIQHIHYVGDRGYKRHWTKDFYRNMLMAANIIGGEKWMQTVYEGMTVQPKIGFDCVGLYDVMQDAQESSSEEAARFAKVRHRSLDEQLIWFRENQIAH